jgi:anti-sigma regulatory factor (Ser/Thr protein kinase)
VEVETAQSMIHAALLYTSADDAARRLVPSIHAALDNDAAVLVCLDAQKAGLISAGLGSRAKEVSFLAGEDRYSRPVRAVDALAQFIAASHRDGATAVHSIGEIQLDGSGRDAEWLRYEAATNDIFQDVPLHATCLYPRSLDSATLAAIGRTHPYIDDHGITASAGYEGAHAACAHVAAARLAPDREPDMASDKITDPRQARSMISEALSRGGPPGIVDITWLVVSELVTNAILHGGGHASMSLWIEPWSLYVTVHDDGPGIDDPFAGLRPPALPHRGAGLWVAHHLSDRVSIERSPLGGAAITVQLSATAN